MLRLNSFSYGSFFGSGSSGFGSSIYNNLSQLSSIRSRAYSKALTAYYGKSSHTEPAKKAAKSKYFDYPSAANTDLTKISRESSELVAASKKLTENGKDSLFSSQETYDPDAAYKAAGAFVSSYNETLAAAGKTTNSTVRSSLNSMTKMAGIMTKSLDSIGITVGKGGNLSIDEETFKNADFEKVRSMLGASGSFARIIASSAQRLGSAAEQQSRQSAYGTGLYGRNGSSYGYNGYAGSGFNAWF